MLREDLKRAEIPYETRKGFVDFHALRHTFISKLVASGISVKAAQTLARHCNPSLTIGRYSHTDDSELRNALGSALPPM